MDGQVGKLELADLVELQECWNDWYIYKYVRRMDGLERRVDN